MAMEIQARTGCCGAYSIMAVYPHTQEVFNGRTTLSILGRKNRILQEMHRNTARRKDSPKYGHSRSVEIILTRQEIQKNPEFARWLRKVGFKCVQRWLNPSGSECYSLLWTAKSLPINTDESAWHESTVGTPIMRPNLLGAKEPTVK